MSALQTPLKVKFYTTTAGNCPVWNFIEDLTPEEQRYFNRAIERCETVPLSHLKSSGELGKMAGYDLYELRIRIKHNIYRILCVIKGVVLWLLHAFQKKSQKIKQKEINTALERFNELKFSSEYTYGL